MLHLNDFDQKISISILQQAEYVFFVLMRCDEYVHGYIDVDPEVDIENLCLLFSNLRKGRLHYMRQLQMFQKVEYGGEPIFKVVLEC